jgi:hypothetical protein
VNIKKQAEELQFSFNDYLYSKNEANQPVFLLRNPIANKGGRILELLRENYLLTYNKRVLSDYRWDNLSFYDDDDLADFINDEYEKIKSVQYGINDKNGVLVKTLKLEDMLHFENFGKLIQSGVLYCRVYYTSFQYFYPSGSEFIEDYRHPFKHGELVTNLNIDLHEKQNVFYIRKEGDWENDDNLEVIICSSGRDLGIKHINDLVANRDDKEICNLKNYSKRKSVQEIYRYENSEILVERLSVVSNIKYDTNGLQIEIHESEWKDYEKYKEKTSLLFNPRLYELKSSQSEKAIEGFLLENGELDYTNLVNLEFIVNQVQELIQHSLNDLGYRSESHSVIKM